MLMSTCRTHIDLRTRKSQDADAYICGLPFVHLQTMCRRVIRCWRLESLSPQKFLSPEHYQFVAPYSSNLSIDCVNDFIYLRIYESICRNIWQPDRLGLINPANARNRQHNCRSNCRHIQIYFSHLIFITRVYDNPSTVYY